jgi:hypothetical protein
MAAAQLGAFPTSRDFDNVAWVDLQVDERNSPDYTEDGMNLGRLGKSGTASTSGHRA